MAHRRRTPAFTLHSRETGTEYWIYVEAPDRARHPGPWPAVAFMDGDDQFAAAVQAYRDLPDDHGVPPLLLVGVGYGASYARPANRRGRDYTPVRQADEPASGGGDAFLAFLTATLWPELDRRHSIDPAMRGVAGHSLGSLLVLHALFQPKPFFTHFLASAPSIWWADRAILRQADDLRARQAGLPGKLFLGAGAKDSESMLDDLDRLEQSLAARPFEGLELVSRRFPKKNHYNVLPVAFSAGLTALFGRGREA